MTGDAWSDRTPSPPLLRGIALNPSAPTQVLSRLLEAWPEQVCEGLRRRRDLPAPVRAAMLRHPSPRIRGALACHPEVDAAARAALLADPDRRVRWRAFGVPGQQPLSDAVLIRLFGELDDEPADMRASRDELLHEVFAATRYDRRLFALAAAHPRPGVRRFAAGSLALLDEPTRQALLTDLAPDVRAAAESWVAEDRREMEPVDLPTKHTHGFWSVLQRRLSCDLVDQVLAGGDHLAMKVMGGNPTVEPAAVETLSRHPPPPRAVNAPPTCSGWVSSVRRRANGWTTRVLLCGPAPR